ncbi:hypothetical protein CPC08DRAFT_705080 [Agrocybe pediades]|nr:hypothetical protein CPC08DRAFT_705080 [Agrocybe pediades]
MIYRLPLRIPFLILIQVVFTYARRASASHSSAHRNSKSSHCTPSEDETPGTSCYEQAHAPLKTKIIVLIVIGAIISAILIGFAIFAIVGYVRKRRNVTGIGPPEPRPFDIIKEKLDRLLAQSRETTTDTRGDFIRVPSYPG